jgi:membrane protein implicated in regulation of membrane protease activity
MFLMLVAMLLPLLALPIFWILPPAAALPIYIVFVALSAVMFRIMRRSMKLPPQTGAEHLIGKEAKVVSKSPPGDAAPYLVRLEGELWSAESADILQPGERVIVAAVRSNCLIVERVGNPYS